MMRAAPLAWFFLLVVSSPGLCQTPPPDSSPIEPDRPDVTNGPHLVDIGLLQIEMGGLYAHVAAARHAFGTPLMARVGMTEWFEIRFGTDGVLTQIDEAGRATGLGNIQLGAKLRLRADRAGVPVLSVLPTVNLPTASAEKGLGSGDADYTVALLAGTDVGRHGHVDVNYGIGAIGVGRADPHFIQHLVSVSASAAVSDSWNPYVEGFWISREDPDGRTVAAIDAGAIYQVGARCALDGGVQIGVTRSAPILAAFGGFSIVVGDVLGTRGVQARQRQARKRAARRAARFSSL